MESPKISVIIPAYNGASFLGQAIQSVVDQTYANFELIVVDDASVDDTARVVKQFDDMRLKYILHDGNRGVDVARHTGLLASAGEIIAFLDQDDYYHREKLQAHATFLESHPDVGFAYNARFELNHSSQTIRELWRPPLLVSLADLVLWFPIAPSEAVLRRKWALQMDLAGGILAWCGGEILHFGRLFLDGCKFASVDRALNYRRHHSGRIFRDLSGGCASELYAQSLILADPRCPAEVVALRNIAHANIYMFWAFCAFAQHETALGQDFVRNAVSQKPSIVDSMPCELVSHFLINCIDDENQKHETLLQNIYAQLPEEMSQLSAQFGWAVNEGYLLKGARSVMWNRLEDGRRHFEQAAKRGAQVDEFFLNALTQKLLDYEVEFGSEATEGILRALNHDIEKLGGRTSVRRLRSRYAVNRAFNCFKAGNHAEVPATLLRAVVNNPKYLANRGVLSVFFHSTIGHKERRML